MSDKEELTALLELAEAEKELVDARTRATKRKSKMVGMIIMGFGCVVGLCVALIAQVHDQAVGFGAAGLVLAVIVFGGMIMDPDRYERIAGRLIDAAPGGKH